MSEHSQLKHFLVPGKFKTSITTAKCIIHVKKIASEMMKTFSLSKTFVRPKTFISDKTTHVPGKTHVCQVKPTCVPGKTTHMPGKTTHEKHLFMVILLLFPGISLTTATPTKTRNLKLTNLQERWSFAINWTERHRWNTVFMYWRLIKVALL